MGIYIGDKEEYKGLLCMVMDSETDPDYNGCGDVTLAFEDGSVLHTKVRRVESGDYELIESHDKAGGIYDKAKYLVEYMRYQLVLLGSVEKVIELAGDLPENNDTLAALVASYIFKSTLSTIQVSSYKPSGKYYLDEKYQVHELPLSDLIQFIRTHFNSGCSGGYVVVTELKDFKFSKGFYEYLFKTDELFGGDDE